MKLVKQDIFYNESNQNNDHHIGFDFTDDLLNLDCFSVADRADDLECLKDARLQQWLQLDEFLLLGTGGSSLGAKCIYEFSRQSCENKKKIHFINNLDPNSLEQSILKIDNLDRCGILCVSKSGETLETIVQLLLILQKIGSMEDISSKVVVITENKNSTLKQIAIEKNFLCFDHPKTIGGRFSVFSIVGMLPALICGIPPEKIRAGGREILHSSFDETLKDGILFVVNNFRKGIRNHVSFIYSDKLLCFGYWLAQLYAESSGKNGMGITPITAQGSIDQHSQLQLYLDGSFDKCFSFFQEQQSSDICINDAPSKFSYICNTKISKIFEAQCNATINSMSEKKLPVRKFTFADVTPEILGQLFMYFMIEVSCVCKLIEVNPYDQPAVERGKILTKQLLNEKNI